MRCVFNCCIVVDKLFNVEKSESGNKKFPVCNLSKIFVPERYKKYFHIFQSLSDQLKS